MLDVKLDLTSSAANGGFLNNSKKTVAQSVQQPENHGVCEGLENLSKSAHRLRLVQRLTWSSLIEQDARLKERSKHYVVEYSSHSQTQCTQALNLQVVQNVTQFREKSRRKSCTDSDFYSSSIGQQKSEMLKRKFDELESTPNAPSKVPMKNSLDSDEEDDEIKEDTYNVMNEDEFEGAEEGPTAPETNVGFTAFNMKEELEEGHFDKEGHYLWNKEKQVRDNWLDNIDWVQIKPSTAQSKKDTKDSEEPGLADSDSDEESTDIMFDPTQLYKQILQYLQPGETVSKALCRLGKGKKRLTTAERWKRKKEAQDIPEDQSSMDIIKLTELANELLTRTGNMDIYQESYEHIKKKVESGEKHAHPSKQEAELDMYSDDFDQKEKAKLDTNESKEEPEPAEESDTEEVTWELKWSQNENAEIHGPHSTQQMQTWSKEGYFKSGAWVRRVGQQNQFYSAARVDFELYL